MAITKVFFERVSDYDRKTCFFQTSRQNTLKVRSFDNGVAVVEPILGDTFTSFVDMIVGCFHAESNFVDELVKAFKCSKNTAFIGIRFEFNDIPILVTKENADNEKIYSEWNAKLDTIAKQEYLENEEYINLPEYRLKLVRQLKKKFRKELVQKEVVAIDEFTEFEFKDDEAKVKWEKMIEANSGDDCSISCIKYASRWAKYMQHLMKKHNKKVFYIAENSSYLSDIEGMFDFIHACAVNILSKYWKYGEEVVIWHNKKFGYENLDEVANILGISIDVE